MHTSFKFLGTFKYIILSLETNKIQVVILGMKRNLDTHSYIIKLSICYWISSPEMKCIINWMCNIRSDAVSHFIFNKVFNMCWILCALRKIVTVYAFLSLTILGCMLKIDKSVEFFMLFNWNIIDLHWFQVCDIRIWYFSTLQIDHHDEPSLYMSHTKLWTV